MNILYLSSHEILEFDEISLFTEMGHNVISMGAYQGSNQGTGIRGPIPNLYENPELRELSLNCTKENLNPELIDWADVVVMMHNSPVVGIDHPQPWLSNNWKKFKAAKKPVVWRAIGQSTQYIEKSLEKYRKDSLKIVRYCPKEDNIPSYQGMDALIRFYKDPEEYKGYVGSTPQLVNVSQSMFGSPQVPSRGDHMNLQEFKEIVSGLPWKIFGPDNDFAGENNGGILNFADLKTMLRFNRAFIYMGTRPASYTLAFIEAMMTGIPVVCVGPAMGNSVYTDQNTFEAHEILGDSGEYGFWSDSTTELNDICKRLLEDQELAVNVGQKGRGRAIELFGKENIKRQWEEFFSKL